MVAKEHTEENAVSKKSYWKSFLGRFSVFLILLVLLWNTFQIWMMSGVVASINKYNLGAVDEMGKVVGEVKEFANDLNEIRRFLLLPERQYGINGEEQGPEISGAEDNSENAVALFKFLDLIKKEEVMALNRAAAEPFWAAFWARPDLAGRLQEAALTTGEKGDLQVKFLDNLAAAPDGPPNENFGLPLFSLVFSPEENLYRMQSVLGDKDFADYQAENFPDEVLNYLKENAVKAREKKYTDAQNAQKLADEAAQKAVADKEQQKQELQKLVSDKAFLDTISGMGLKLAEVPREESNKLIYDILGQDGRVTFSLALEVSSGMIKLIKDNQEIDLKNFLTDDGSKKKP